MVLDQCSLSIISGSGSSGLQCYFCSIKVSTLVQTGLQGELKTMQLDLVLLEFAGFRKRSRMKRQFHQLRELTGL